MDTGRGMAVARSGESPPAEAPQPGIELAVDLASTLETDEVHRRIAERATAVADADRATLFCLEGDELVVEAAFDREGRPVVTGVRLALRDHPPFREAMAGRRPVQVTDPSYTGFPENLRSALRGGRHAMVLPLEFEGEVLGFLNLLRRRDEPFDESSAAALRGIASVAAVSLRNARLYAEARAARVAMSEFLDSVVHELRSPLTVAVGYVSMLREGIFGEVPQRWEQPLAMIDDKLSDGQRLVEELLLAARLEAGTVPLHVRSVDLRDAARRAAERAAPRAALQGAHLTIDQTDAAVWVAADLAAVDRILDNLVNNAMSYGGDPADVTLRVAGGRRPSLTVSDRGAGVPAQDRSHIFKRFYRGGNTGGVSGSGLGLYLSRRLAEAGGGSLELADSTTAGTGFVLRLPAAHAEA